MKVSIKDKIYDLEVPETFEEKRLGLSQVDELMHDEGMMFVFNSGKEVEELDMNTADMNLPINMLFIGQDKKVKEVFKAEPGIDKITRNDIAYVIELKAGEAEDSIGAEVDFITEEQKNIIIGNTSSPMSLQNKMKMGGKIDIKADTVDIIPEAMQVLDDKGNVVMNIFGGERIFSIAHTKEIIELAEKVHTGAKDPEELGKLISKIIKIHETQEPQYTDD